MRRIVIAGGVILLMVMLIPSFASADSFTFTWGEQNGPGLSSPYNYTLDAGAYIFNVPAGQSIIDATFTSTLGNSAVADTAVMGVFVNTVEVGSCPSTSSTCWTSVGPFPFSYAFTASDLMGLTTGSIDLSIVQTDCCVIRLGTSTLTIDTAATTTPEPATLALVGAGLFGLAALRRRKVA